MHYACCDGDSGGVGGVVVGGGGGGVGRGDVGGIINGSLFTFYKQWVYKHTEPQIMDFKHFAMHIPSLRFAHG